MPVRDIDNFFENVGTNDIKGKLENDVVFQKSIFRVLSLLCHTLLKKGISMHE